MSRQNVSSLPPPPFLGSRIVFITAHPDDESYAFAGLCLENVKHGGTNVLICLTDGEQGRSHLKKKITIAALRRLRQRELQSSARVLHIQKIIRGHFPDGQVPSPNGVDLPRLLKKIRSLQGQVIVSFGPDGITGHRDHILAGRIAGVLAKKLRVPLLRGVLPLSEKKHLQQWLHSRVGSRHYVASEHTLAPQYGIRFSPLAKQRALQCHRSQMDGPKQYTGYAPFSVKALEHFEYYV